MYVFNVHVSRYKVENPIFVSYVMDLGSTVHIVQACTKVGAKTMGVYCIPLFGQIISMM